MQPVSTTSTEPRLTPQVAQRPGVVTLLAALWLWGLLAFLYSAIDLRSSSYGLSAFVCAGIIGGLWRRWKVAAVASTLLMAASVGGLVAEMIVSPQWGHGAGFNIGSCLVGAVALYSAQTRAALGWFGLPSTRVARLAYWVICGVTAAVAEFWFVIVFSRHA